MVSHCIGGIGFMKQGNEDQRLDQKQYTEEVVPVIEERAVVQREIIETGKVHIRKKVTEEKATVNLPIINESYEVLHVPVPKQVLDAPPPAVRYEGDKMIIPVIKEITVMQKKYEVIEEVHVIRHVTETPLVQEITLLKESVQVERSQNNR